MNRAWLAWVVGVLALAGCAARAPESSAAQQFGVTGGVPDSTDTNVFLLVEHAPPFFATCSGTLIAPNLILTAHHCVVGDTGSGAVQCGVTMFGPPVPASSFAVTNAEDVSSGSVSYYQAQTVDVPPGGDGCGFDLALLTLSENVPATVPPAVPRVDLRAMQGETYTAVGYGQDAAGNGAGQRRSRAGQMVACTPGSCGGISSSSEFLGADGVCEGDSGSPALDSEDRVIGVDSRGESGCTSPIYSSVEAWSDWIIGVAQTAAQVGGYNPPAWTSGSTSAGGSSAGGSSGGGSSGSPGTAGSAAAGEQGAPCMQQSDCRAGFKCFSYTGQASNAFCAADCTAQMCGTGLSCDPNSKVCLSSAPQSTARDSSSCALAPAREPRSFAGSSLGVLAVLALVRRRRASAHRKKTG